MDNQMSQRPSLQKPQPTESQPEASQQNQDAAPQDVGMPKAPEVIHQNEKPARIEPILLLNSKNDMVLSGDFKLKESLDHMSKISQRMGLVNSENGAHRERQKRIHGDSIKESIKES